MNGEVEAQELHELWIVVAEHVGEVGAPVELRVNCAHRGTVAVQVSVNDGSHGG